VGNPIRSLAIVSPFYPPHVGGIERYAQEFARAAADLGLSVNVVTTDAVPKPIETVEDSGLRLLRLPAYNLPVMGSHYPIAFSWRKANEFLRCDVVMAHTRFFMTTLAAATATARMGKRICVVDHGSGPLRSSPRALALASLAYEHAATAALKRLAARFFAVSAASANWLRRFGIANAPVLPNSVASLATPPHQQVLGNRKKSVVFYAGRLLAEKGVLELVDGVELLAERGYAVEVRIAGEGPLAETLRRRAASSSRVIYLGRVAHSIVEKELSDATVFVNPSKLPEGSPTVLLEAGLAALPVISTPFGGSAELIHHGHTGWIIPSSDAESIAAALTDVISHPEEASRRGMALFRYEQENYTWPSTVRRFLEYLQ
jgi:glycosyltransferase involved in cell wall biosynthesis